MISLAIDIGNTNIAIGVFKGKKLLKRYSIPTLSLDYRVSLKKIIKRYGVQAVIICSVVPKATPRLIIALKGLIAQKPYIIGEGVIVPISNLYKIPGQVGADRLVNAFAAGCLYGTPLIAVDFGTAITFDCISERGAYLGGVILPGLQLSLGALSSGTALLPKVKLGKPTELIGRDTRSSMLSGVVFGLSSLTEELVKKLKAKIGRKAKVIGTGGDIDLMAGYCRVFDRIDNDLTLKGLNLILFGGGKNA